MGSFTWSQTYATNINAIDADHRNLFELVDSIEDHRRAGSESDAVSAAINGLVMYTVEHFDREERFLRRVNYPEFEAHRRSHEEFKGLIRALKDIHAQDPLAVDLEKVTRFLGKWILDHIMIKDMDYVPYVNGTKHADTESPGERSGKAFDRRAHPRPKPMSSLTISVPPDKEAAMRRFAQLMTEGGDLANALEKALHTHEQGQSKRFFDRAHQLFGKR